MGTLGKPGHGVAQPRFCKDQMLGRQDGGIILFTVKESFMPRQSSARAVASIADNDPSRSATETQHATGEFTISDLARDFGVTLRTLRFYRRGERILPPDDEVCCRLYRDIAGSSAAVCSYDDEFPDTLIEVAPEKLLKADAARALKAARRAK